jgi:hypothetical protein
MRKEKENLVKITVEKRSYGCWDGNQSPSNQYSEDSFACQTPFDSELSIRCKCVVIQNK